MRRFGVSVCLCTDGDIVRESFHPFHDVHRPSSATFLLLAHTLYQYHTRWYHHQWGKLRDHHNTEGSFHIQLSSSEPTNAVISFRTYSITIIIIIW